MITETDPIPLVAVPGGPYNARTDEPLELDGSRSTGPAGFTYSWSLSGGDSAHMMIADQTSSKPRVMFSSPGDYEAKLTIASGDQSRDSSARIKVEQRSEPPTPVTSDDDWWQTKFLESRRNALAAVRASAEKWQGLLATVLGLFGTVAFVTAPATLDKLPSDRGAATVVLVVFAFGLALAALLSSAAAGHATPKIVDGLDGATFREKTLEEYNRALGHLRNARVLVLLAIVTVVVGSLVAWSTTLFKQPSTGTMAIIRAGTSVYCGPVAPGASASEPLMLDGSPIPSPVDELLVVDSCPAAASSASWFETNKKALKGAGVASALIAVATLGWWMWSGPKRKGVAIAILTIAAIAAAIAFTTASSAFGWTVVSATAVFVGGCSAQALVGRVVRAL